MANRKQGRKPEPEDESGEAPAAPKPSKKAKEPEGEQSFKTVANLRHGGKMVPPGTELVLDAETSRHYLKQGAVVKL
jgi:hypothetical protein